MCMCVCVYVCGVCVCMCVCVYVCVVCVYVCVCVVCGVYVCVCVCVCVYSQFYIQVFYSKQPKRRKWIFLLD